MNEIDENVFTVEPENEEALEHVLATVQTVEASGLTLIWDGETESDGKIYKCNAYQIFHIGDRVKVSKISGTYVVDYVIGAPAKSGSTNGFLPTGGVAGQFLKKSSNANYACEWATFSVSGTLPSGGTDGQYLKKSGRTDYSCEWATISVSGTLPTGGTTGQYLKKSSNTNYACEWAAVSVSGTLPSGGTQGQYLAKSSSTAYACSWVTPPVAGGTNTIGFMNTAAKAKQTVQKCSTSGTLSNAITTINNLLTALNTYGLITSY